MKKRTRFSLYALGAIGLAVGGGAVASTRSSDATGPATVTVARGDVVDQALAVGTIEPEISVSVKSKVSGVVGRAFADEGAYVTAGQPLLEIRPDPTPLEQVEAERDVDMKEIDVANRRKDVERKKALAQRGLISQQDLEESQRSYDEAALQLRTSREKLQLLQSGRIRGSDVESVVRAPISGSILERMVEPGDPVVPLTSYQEGTVLMTMADMNRLLFKGSVDEIDVGRLREGMPVEIKIGALPDAKVTGRLSRISLQGKKEESATTFPVEATLDPAQKITLRAGLSANANVIVRERRNVLVIPERVVIFDKDSAWVMVPGPDGTPRKRMIATGLSDALQVEVLSGLKEGEKVLEKPVMKVE
ncbi:MAG TPA: efflux RND transporter periplasmic adaptor subunit [Longimicrobiaceae bacterium]|nr:efflux RND transporter periplasmic adaptor subunit [Longimicrobiaceae bacterium]